MQADLGTIEGQVLLFGGPYSNLQATQAVLAQAKLRGIDAGNMICTGDVVAYCAEPVQTVATLRRAGVPVVAGNCEKQLAARALDCGCGFDEGTACDLLSAGWFGFANAQVTEQDRLWMARCPDVVSFTHHGARYGVIHGGATDIARFMWSTMSEDIFDAEWEALEAFIGPVDHVIAGHSGIPFVRVLARGRWINAGVIGMPPNDGRPQTRYAILSGGEVTFHDLSYDYDGAIAAMEHAGLIQGYHGALRSGYWPSEEVLPRDLRRGVLANG